MKKTFLIPTKIQSGINYIINSDIDLIYLKEKQKAKLSKTLITLWYFIYQKQRDDDTTHTLSGYTNISSLQFDSFKFQYNKKRLKYRQLLQLLEEAGMISINDKFSSGVFSKAYRVNTSFISNDLTEVELDFDKIYRKLNNKEYWIKKYPKHIKNIKESYDVTIDLGAYINWLNSNKGIELKPVITNGVLSKRYLTEERIFDYIQDALKVNFSNLWFKVSDEGRFYNSLTNLSYTTLSFLSLKGKSVVELDVVNCQPLLLSLIVTHEGYKKDVQDGVFYEKMADMYGVTRNEFKMLSYRYIFFNNNTLKSGRVYNALESIYPGLIKEINEIRNEMNISRELQKIESSILVDKIGQLDYKMMLRHDAVFVYEEDYKIVCDILKKEFSKKGLKVTIKN